VIEPALVSLKPLLKQVAVLTEVVQKAGQVGVVCGLKKLCKASRPLGDPL
jgi:hypothetical protein